MKEQDQAFVDLRNPGIAGLNVFDDASNIGDQELAEAQNVTYDGGFLSPRLGSSLFAEKPSGEDEDPLQLLIARTSDGLTYKIPVYGNHFYLWHPDSEEFILLNPIFEPEETDLPYGWVNWNNGRGDDRLYACNGVDSFVRWDPAVSRLDSNHSGSVSLVTLEDATRFPEPTSKTISSVDTGTEQITSTAHGFLTGDLIFYHSTDIAIGGLAIGGIYFVIRVDANTVKLATTYANAIAGTAIDLTTAGGGTQKLFSGQTILLIKDGSTTLQKGYISKSGNDLTLATSLGTAMPNESAVALMVVPKPSMEIGKLVAKHQSRLYTSNYRGGETTIWYSVRGEPENFTTGSSIEDASTAVISDGNGEITALHDFGQFLVVEKEDSFHRFSIKLSDDLNTKLDVITPVLSGQSVGPLGQHSTVKVFNNLIFPTRSEGFVSVAPTSTGDNASVSLSPISQKIQPLVNSLVFDNCRGVAFDRKIFWSAARNGATENSLVLLYDMARGSWAVIAGWAVQDWGYDNGELFFLESVTGNIIQCFTGGFDDSNNPYEVRATTKRLDFGKMSKPKTNDLIYLQGYMTPATDLYVDVKYNEGGVLRTQTFRLNENTERIYFSDPLTSSLGQPEMGMVALGYVSLQEIGNLSFFRCYLGISNREGYFNLQLTFRQNKEAFFAITGIGINPFEELVAPSTMVVDPVVED